MGISTTQYRDIMYAYDQRRMRNQQLADRRMEEISQQIPAVAELQEQLIQLSFRQARAELLQPEQAAESAPAYQQKLSQLIQQKSDLLTEHGYPADYLAPIYTCPDCRDTGYIGSKPCHCLIQAESDILYQDSNLGDILQSENFETFCTDFYDNTEIDENLSTTARENILKIKNICLAFVENFDNSCENIIFYGPTGVGKTFMTHCIAKELLDTGHSVIYLTSLQLFAILEKNKFNRESDTPVSDEQISHLLHCDLLILDDLGTELTNSSTISQLYYFIEERHLQKRSTIISTNISFHDLHERYGERIFSRFTGYYNFYKIIGDDIRPKKRLHAKHLHAKNV